jgi:hypothetical protein
MVELLLLRIRSCRGWRVLITLASPASSEAKHYRDNVSSVQDLNAVVIAFYFVRLVAIIVLTLDAPPLIASQENGFPVRKITMQRLSAMALLTSYNEIPRAGDTIG